MDVVQTGCILALHLFQEWHEHHGEKKKTLGYLASGMNFGDLELDFHVSRKTIPLIVKETCEAIWEVMHRQAMPTPDKQMWLTEAKEFNEITNFPHCIGAVDGKHKINPNRRIINSLATQKQGLSKQV
ncbi:uncharacterized protein LOC143026275 [Oratosquilla oratoria]|uniref:uncharacterized protein LOC143026275 n=1 Tax=Oratosquilla oratoria TaxID=337810 RepID=UPI003F75B63A